MFLAPLGISIDDDKERPTLSKSAANDRSAGYHCYYEHCDTFSTYTCAS